MNLLVPHEIRPGHSMPILPLDYPEPFVATIGVMLYPDDERKARSLAAEWLAAPLEQYHQAGHRMDYEQLMRIASSGGVPVDDYDDRLWAARTTGEQFKALWALYNMDRRLATWNNAIRIAEKAAGKKSGARSVQWKARRRFLSVAHLWAAWSIRGGKLNAAPDVGYDYPDDFLVFPSRERDPEGLGTNVVPPSRGKQAIVAE